MRWTDVVGLVGLVVLVTGVLFLFPRSADQMNWMYRLGGGLLWLVGFASIVVSILARWAR
jgi:hypothetical protein